MSGKNIIQYTPWIDCRVGCDFCFTQGQLQVDKIQSLNYLMGLLDKPEVNHADGFGVIGGEFFQDQLKDSKVRSLFYKFIKKILDVIEDRNLSIFWVATSLIFKPEPYFYPFLDYIADRNLIDRLLICTSWDSQYRFKSKKAEELWANNIRALHIRYPNLKIHVETILTEHLMQLYLNGFYNKHSFEEKYGVRVDYLEPNTGFQKHEKMLYELKGFLAKRNTFLQFVQEIVFKEWTSQEQLDFLNPDIRSNVVYNIENGKHHRIGDRHIIPIRLQPTQHQIKYGYVDSDRTMEEDYQLLKGMIL